MNRKLLVAAVALMAGLPALAKAETPGLYFELGGAVNLPMDSNVHLFNAGAANRISGNAEWSTGFAVHGKVGYALPPIVGLSGFRVEEELSWSYSDLNKFGSNRGTGTYTGRKQDFRAMTNLLYDFDLGLPVTPFIGVGVGYDESNQQIGRLGVATPLRLRGWNQQFAYQGIAGVAYALNDHLRLTGEYHYVSSINPTYSTQFAGTNSRARSQDADHQIFLGVRYVLGTPMMTPAPTPVATMPPPPPPPPVVVPEARSFQIFFDFDKSVITPQAQQVLQRAAQSAQQQGVTRITLTGHTDTVGSNAYNLALSRRRADATKAALVRLGVPAGAISATGVGKANLLVPTADGVREPQNRRVEIVLG